MNVTVGRMRLRTPGRDADTGARLAQLIAERLAPPLTLPPGVTTVEKLEVEIQALPGEDPESLAGRITARLAGQLTRHSLQADR